MSRCIIAHPPFPANLKWTINGRNELIYGVLHRIIISIQPLISSGMGIKLLAAVFMNDNSNQKVRAHNTVVGIITIASIGTITGSIALGWEFWVPPLIVCAMIAMWIMHFTEYGTWEFRENYYLILTMLLSFYHGVHFTSTYEVVVVSALLMVNVTLLKRKQFITFMLIECIILMILQVVMGIRLKTMVLDTLTVSKLSLHILAELCIYKGLYDAIKNNRIDSEEIELRNNEKETERAQLEDFLVNISHELRTPVNVVNGMSSMILKKEDRDDVRSIRDAGLRLSRQIEDIQDYSEIQRGDIVLEEDKYMITSVLNDIISGYKVWEGKNDLELIIDLDPCVPAVLKGDAGKINKIIWHLLDNAVKFTEKGGIYLKVTSIRREYGINLVIEVTDTGTGISARDMDKISKGLYRGDKSRSRRTSGIGLGFSIVYGFVRTMNGFVNITSKRGRGTTVRASIAQEIIDPSPCMSVDDKDRFNVVFYVFPKKIKASQMMSFYRNMASNMAAGLKIRLYSASSIDELKKLMEKGDITHVFMGEDEYNNTPEYLDRLAEKGISVAVSAAEEFEVREGSCVTVLRKPLYGCSVIKVLSGETEPVLMAGHEVGRRPVLDGIRALVVDDEPMNLVVAAGIFREYNMIIDTAQSGRESIIKFAANDYDIIFMDHMMPEMDGIEAMKHLRDDASREGRSICIVALTANAVSGAKEMFLREGFDGFISKPISISEFERVMNRVLPAIRSDRKGGQS